MSRVRRWWLRRLNGNDFVAPPLTPQWQVGCPEILEGLRAQPVWLRGGPGTDAPPELAWVRRLEENVTLLRDELDALRTSGGFQPYRSPSARNVDGFETATDSGSWNVFYLELHNMDFAKNRERCPRTCALLESLPRAYGHAFFSAASPSTHITPHHGPTNKKLRCHLPIFCPETGCRLRVADQTIQLVEGEAIVFDDSFLHEAWNDHPTTPRIVLVVDIWHPDLSDKEIKFLNFLQTAAMRRDKRVCEARGDSEHSFYSVIDRARSVEPDPAEIWS